MNYFFENISLEDILDEKVHNLLSDTDMQSLLKDKENYARISG